MAVKALILVSLFCLFHNVIAIEDDNCVLRDCKDILKQSKLQKKCVCSGIYTIKPDNKPPFKVYCDMETDGGGWTVFQRRLDGSRNFYLYWKNYDLGFGDLNGEFWLGLNKIHHLTTSSSSLRVDLEDFNGNKRFAKYSVFSVANAVTQYKLSVGGYSGNAGDSFSYHSGKKFSTRDRDNDIWSGHCAHSFKGAWWYGACHSSNLNGLYLFGPHNSYANGVNWSAWLGYHYSLKFTEMKFRRNN